MHRDPCFKKVTALSEATHMHAHRVYFKQCFRNLRQGERRD